MLNVKLISRAAIPAALAKAERYRLLNEPDQAESICRDVLAIDPGDQKALVMLLLSLTDQFRANSTVGVRHAEEALGGLRDAYERAYYAGIIRERWARALLAGGDPAKQAYVWLSDAMQWYEKADALGPDDNDDPILRWNSCVRTIQREQLYEIEPEGLGGAD
jgi:hypothetical protein